MVVAWSAKLYDVYDTCFLPRRSAADLDPQEHQFHPILLVNLAKLVFVMNGMVYTLFSEMVEGQFGSGTWSSLKESTQPKSKGIYVSAEEYADQELVNYIDALSAKTRTAPSELIYGFGEFMLSRLEQTHPEYFENHDAKSFLKSAHDVIPAEIKKRYPDAVLPVFDYEEQSNGGLVVLYHSPGNLCALAEGLISGTAKHYATSIVCSHDSCMLYGADHCRLALTFSAAKS